MNKAFLMIASSLAVLSLVSLSMAAGNPNANVLNSFEGNLTQKQLGLATMVEFFGQSGLNVAETVKFKAPRSGWKLQNASILAWDGFNGSLESVPKDRIIALEVRDKDLNLLYRFVDVQRAYSNFVFNQTIPMFMTIDLPSVPVSDEFYICFYDRGAVVVLNERLNQTGNSYLFNKVGKELAPAELPLDENKTTSVNWMMVASGT